LRAFEELAGGWSGFVVGMELVVSEMERQTMRKLTFIRCVEVE
jgi:hypothetical protein